MCPRMSWFSGCLRNEFETLYTKYEQEGRGRSINAQRRNRVLQSQIEMKPYLYIKMRNEKSNQKNLGTIKSSNLCCEIVEYSSPEEAQFVIFLQ